MTAESAASANTHPAAARAFGRGGQSALGLALLAIVSIQLITCAGPGAEARATLKAPPEAPTLTLAWASTAYGMHEPEGAAVELLVVVRNPTGSPTTSTSIEWSPTFAAAFHVHHSEPPAWRVHQSEDGWGILDTGGTPPQQDGTYRVWFAPAPTTPRSDTPESPRIRVVADGGRLIGEGIATSLHVRERVTLDSQLVFERGPLARLADRAGSVPNTALGVFPAAVAVSSALLAVTAAGVAAAAHASNRLAC